jgi:putative ABC transport system permease protein
MDVGGGGYLCEIIGVVGDARDINLETEPGAEIYRPYIQQNDPESALLVRTAVDPLTLGNATVDRIWSVYKGERVLSVMSMKDLISKSVVGPRFHMALLGLFAALALALATVGIYGVVAHSVSARTQEIGIRMALGAQPRDVLSLVVGHGLILALVGVSVGLIGAFALTRFSASLLYGVSATDPATFVTAALTLILSPLVASYIPARRAIEVDPTQALRHE